MAIPLAASVLISVVTNTVARGPFRLDRVIEKLATSDEVTLTVERLPEGKMRVTSSSWDAERVFAPDQVLEVRWVDGCLRVARKDRHLDQWTVRSRPMTPTGLQQRVRRRRYK